MKKSRLFAVLSITVIFVFITSLFSTVNVLADDSTPPASTQEPVELPTSEPVETEPAPTSLPETDPTETSDVDTPAEILESAPEGVDVVVLDENGDALPMATEEAAQIIMSGDPIWCPDIAGLPQTAPQANTNGCTSSYASFADLIADLASGAYSGNGTIFVEYNYSDAEGDINFNHTSGNLSNLGNLTIQGAWDFAQNQIHDGDSANQSNLGNNALNIYNWVGNVTVNNIFINSPVGGIFIDTQGDVSLDQVEVNDSYYYGAYIETNGDVSVTNSTFTNNGIDSSFDDLDSDPNIDDYQADSGLYIETNGDVTLDEITASGNGLNGVEIYTIGDVIVTNGEFTGNGFNGSYYFESDSGFEHEDYSAAAGLLIDTNGDVTLDDVYAADNGGDGATIFGADVEITNSEFENNGWGESDGYGAEWHRYSGAPDGYYNTNVSGGNGIDITSTGNITLNDICVCGNAGTGAVLDAAGNINITEVGFIENGYFGSLFVQNHVDDDGSSLSVDFSLDYTAGYGLDAESNGTLTLFEVYVAGNANTGAELSANGNISIEDAGFEDNGWGNGLFDYGYCEDGDIDFCGYDLLEEYLVESESDLAFCENIIGYEEMIFNPCEDNDFIAVFGPNFYYAVSSYVDADTYENYYYIYEAGGEGLDAESENGSVTVENAGVYDNAADGAYLEGQTGVNVTDAEFGNNGEMGYLEFGECAGMGFQDCVPDYEDPTEMSFAGDMYLNFEYGDGLDIYSASGITLNAVAAYQNANNGAITDSNGSLFVSDSCFCGNGLPVEIGGEGGLFGYFLYDQFGLEDALTVPGSSLYLNASFFEAANGDGGIFFQLDTAAGSGLLTDTNSNIVLNQVTAGGNLGNGADLYAGGNIAITESDFEGNGFDGYFGGITFALTDDFVLMDIDSVNGSGLSAYADGGTVTLINVGANNNALYGAELFGSNIFVQESSFSNNGSYGSSIHGFHYEDADETIDESYEIYGSGLYIDMYYGGNATLIDVTANNNAQDGVEVYTNGGRVIVSCGQYDGNGYYSPYGGYGISAGQAVSSLELYGPEILGNYYSPDEYYFAGTAILSDDCTIPQDKKPTPVSSGAVVCEDSAETATFMLPKGDFVTFPCPINDFANVKSIGENDLPGKLADAQKFLSGLVTQVTRDNAPVTELERPVEISFLIPKGTDQEKLSILFWDGTEWSDLGGEVSEDGLYFQVSTNLVGTFVLVSK